MRTDTKESRREIKIKKEMEVGEKREERQTGE